MSAPPVLSGVVSTCPTSINCLGAGSIMVREPARPLCGGEDVYVVGGGNSAGQAVMHLAKHAKSVTMLVRDKALAASMSQYLSERILGAANVQVQYDVEITGLDGEEALERIRIGSRTTREANWVATPRLFVAIGGVPNTAWAADTAIVRDQGGYLVTGPDLLTNGKAPASWPMERAPYYLETAVPGSFAAGDVRSRSIKRVATAVGEGAMAVAFVHRYLQETAMIPYTSNRTSGAARLSWTI